MKHKLHSHAIRCVPGEAANFADKIFRIINCNNKSKGESLKCESFAFTYAKVRYNIRYNPNNKLLIMKNSRISTIYRMQARGEMRPFSASNDH